VFTKAQARARRSRAGRWVAHHQAALFFPMLLLEGAALHVASITALRARPVDRARRVESVLLSAHVVGYLAAVFLVLPSVQAVAFIAVQQGLFGVYLGCSFAPAHKGMPLLATVTNWTSSAARCSPRATSAADTGWTWPWAA